VAQAKTAQDRADKQNLQTTQEKERDRKEGNFDHFVHCKQIGLGVELVAWFCLKRWNLG